MTQNTTHSDLLKHVISALVIIFLGIVSVLLADFSEEMTNLALNYTESREYRKTQTNYTNFLFEDNKRLNTQLLISLNESKYFENAYHLCLRDNMRLYE